MLSYMVVDTCRGWMALAGSPLGLRRVVLPQSSVDAVTVSLGITGEMVQNASTFGGLPDRLRAYFAGQRVSFPDKVDLTGAPSFYRLSWEMTRSIPYGATRSYAWVAGQIGKPEAARAVGQAMAKNPVPIVVPCHRVVSSGGGLGGFSGGLELKHWLLEMERGSAPGDI